MQSCSSAGKTCSTFSLLAKECDIIKKVTFIVLVRSAMTNEAA